MKETIQKKQVNLIGQRDSISEKNVRRRVRSISLKTFCERYPAYGYVASEMSFRLGRHRQLVTSCVNSVLIQLPMDIIHDNAYLLDVDKKFFSAIDSSLRLLYDLRTDTPLGKNKHVSLRMLPYVAKYVNEASIPLKRLRDGYCLGGIDLNEMKERYNDDDVVVVKDVDPFSVSLSARLRDETYIGLGANFLRMYGGKDAGTLLVSKLRTLIRMEVMTTLSLDSRQFPKQRGVSRFVDKIVEYLTDEIMDLSNSELQKDSIVKELERIATTTKNDSKSGLKSRAVTTVLMQKLNGICSFAAAHSQQYWDCFRPSCIANMCVAKFRYVGGQPGNSNRFFVKHEKIVECAIEKETSEGRVKEHGKKMYVFFLLLFFFSLSLTHTNKQTHIPTHTHTDTHIDTHEYAHAIQ